VVITALWQTISVNQPLPFPLKRNFQPIPAFPCLTSPIPHDFKRHEATRVAEEKREGWFEPRLFFSHSYVSQHEYQGVNERMVLSLSLVQSWPTRHHNYNVHARVSRTAWSACQVHLYLQNHVHLVRFETDRCEFRYIYTHT